MKITDLEIENFLTIGDRVRLHLADRGLVLIQGANEDDSSALSNGSGKSSLADAPSWALFGITARGESGDAVVNNKRKKNCSVQVVLQDGDSIYEVTRWRKDASYKNMLRLRTSMPSVGTGAWTDLTKGTEKETEAEIEKIIGCSADVFNAAIYAGQEKMPDLPGATDKQLKMVIEEAAGVERLERAYAKARQELTTVSSSLIATEASSVSVSNQIVSAKETELVQQQRVNEFEAGRPALVEAQLQQAKTCAQAVRDAHASLAALNEQALKDELAVLNEQLANHKHYTDEQGKAWSLVQYGQRARAETDAAVKMLAHQVEEWTAHLKHLVSGGENPPCPTCGKPQTPEEKGASVEKAKATLKDYLEKHKGMLEVQARQAEKGAEAQAAYDAATAAIPDVSAAAARVSEINAALRQCDALKASMRSAKMQHDSAKAAAEACKAQVNPHQGALDLARKNIADLEAKAVVIAGQIAELQAQVNLKEAVVKVFSPAGVRAHILDTVTPFLNERTAEYLNTLSDGNISAVWSTLTTTTKGELREKFNIECANDKGATSFKGLSGGEKRKVRLATMLALQDLVAARATKPFDLWIGDEIDDALDDAGLERLMTILEKKAREHGTVLIISHNSLTDWADNVTTVTKSGGTSKVEGCLCA